MRAYTILITGASSGLGREMARRLTSKCSEMILVGRNRDRLEELKAELTAKREGLKVVAVSTDLSVKENCIALHEEFPDVDLLINDAGFGDFGDFDKTSLDKDIKMIETNVTALHILTKLYLVDMIRKDHGHILNVASIAGFMPGPLMSTYYATKAYVVRLSESIREELNSRGSHAGISILCPGPVSTGFEKTANIAFNFFGTDAGKVAEYTLNHLDRFYIVPKLYVKLSRIAVRLIPDSFAAKIVYFLQTRRRSE